MTKRYTETDKWDNPFFQNLTPSMKLVWFYLLEKCDCSGLWKINIRSLCFFTGVKCSVDKIKKSFGKRIFIVDSETLFIPSFIEQQGNYPLNSKNNSHKGIIKRLLKYSLIGDDFLLKEIVDINKNTFENKVIKKEDKKHDFNFEIAYLSYPKKEGRTKGIEKCIKTIKTKEDYDLFLVAIKNYSDKCKYDETETKYIKQFSTFVNCWRDYEYYENPDQKHIDYMRKLVEMSVED